MNYEVKFAEFIKMLEEANSWRANIDAPRVIVLPSPHVLGDTYDEIIESLNRISDIDVPFFIVPRNRRGEK